MDDYALVLNAGSSSLKFCVFQRPATDSWRIEARGQIEGIGTAPAISAKDSTGQALVKRRLGPEVADGRSALDALADWLRSRYAGAKVIAVGHRVVHGGPRFARPALISPSVMDELRSYIPLAPLHQPYNLAAIEAVSARIPGVPQVACFDTSFHTSCAAVARLIPLPQEIRDRGVQRYGFHGLSYEYIASALPDVAPEIANGRVIVAHLGSGSSLCAMHDRVGVDNSLGFTALDGLCMGTRPGSVDPGVILYLMQALGMSAAAIEKLLYKQSGLLGISGFTSDMRVLLGSDDPNARLAVDYFVYQIAKHIGALASVLGGVDALVFTAGIGENSPEIRRRVAASAEWLGLQIDQDANERHASRISRAGSKVSAWVIPTNEELMIARHTADVLGIGGKAHSTRAS